MKIVTSYQTRSIRFVEIYAYNDWKIKIYGISMNREFISTENIALAKKQIGEWLENSKIYDLETYNLATLIIHEGREGCFAIINWWIDENMLQNFVYLLKKGATSFELFSQNGIVTCVWEMAVWWHERNAWVKHILRENENPNINAFLAEQLNQDL